MKDKNGQEITVGAACRFRESGRQRKWHEGTVRALSTRGEVRADDGDPRISSLDDNSFRVSVWTEPKNIEVIPAANTAAAKARRSSRVLCPTCGGKDEACQQCGWLRDHASQGAS